MTIAKNQLKAVESSRNLRVQHSLNTKHKHFNPEWLKKGWIAHPLDEIDLSLLRQNRAHESPSLLALMNEDGFDGKNGVVFMYWGTESKTTCHTVNPKLMDAIDLLEVEGMKVPEIIGELKAISDEEELSKKKASLLVKFMAKAVDDAKALVKSTGKTLLSTKKDLKIEYKYIFKLINHPGFNQDNGTIISRYNGHALDTFWEGMNRRSLDTLRYADPQSLTIVEGEKVNAFQLELEWIASKQYDAVCRLLGIDSNQIRACLPKILRAYGRPIKGYCSKLLGAFKSLQESESVRLVNLEIQSGFQSTVEAKVGNNNTFADVERSKNIVQEKVKESQSVLKKAHQKSLKAKKIRQGELSTSAVSVQKLNLALFV